MIPLWYTAVAVLVAAGVAFWAGRAWPLERKLRAAVAAEARQCGFASGRAHAQTQTAAALTRVVTGVTLAGSDLPPRGEGLAPAEPTSLDVPELERAIDATVVAMRGDAERLLADLDPLPQTAVVTGELVEASATVEAQPWHAGALRGPESPGAARLAEVRHGMEDSATPQAEVALSDPDDPLDVYDSSDDEPEDRQRLERSHKWVNGGDDDPPAGETVAPTMTAGAMGARYGWLGGRAWPAGQGVMPDPRLGSAARMLARRIWLRQLRTSMAGWLRPWWAQMRAYAGERREAWWPSGRDRSPWTPGELLATCDAAWARRQAELDGDNTAMLPVGPAPRRAMRNLPAHEWGRMKVSARALLDGWTPTGSGGRHRLEVAPGALAQRQSRFLALPGGSA